MYVSFNEHCSFLSTKFSSIDNNNSIDRLYCISVSDMYCHSGKGLSLGSISATISSCLKVN